MINKNHSTPPFISVIIPNFNSPLIDDVIDSIRMQNVSYPREIIVIGMDQWNKVSGMPDVRFIETSHAISAAEARNIGIKESKGDWLLFIDADCIARPDWMDVLTRRMKEGWMVVGGGVETDEDDFWPMVYNLAMFHEQLTSKKNEIRKFLPTLNLSVKREVINKVGLMNEYLNRGQDVEWTSRMTLAGYQLVFEPTAIVCHKPVRPDFKSLKDLFFRTGYFSIQTRYRFPEIFTLAILSKNSFLWKFFSPIISAFVTIKILSSTLEVRRNIRALPFIYLLKIYWCIGASEGLKKMKEKHE